MGCIRLSSSVFRQFMIAMPNNQHGLHPYVWVVWVLSAAGLTMLARSPLYGVIVLLVVQIVVAGVPRPGTAPVIPLLRFSLTILLFSALFNGLFVHVGQTVLVRLPAGWPLIGGAITLEAIATGLANGLVLIALLAIFTAFNQLVLASDLVRLVPASWQDLGVVILIAITYVPETRKHLDRIRDAQAIRGHQLRGWRDWQPVVIPLLVGGLERAMGVAEAMVARGYGATVNVERGLGVRVGLFLSLLLTLLGWVAVLWVGSVGWLILSGGILSLVGLVWLTGRGTQRTYYKPYQWRLADSLITIACLIPLVLAFFMPIESRSFSAYPTLTLPPFNMWLGLTLLCLLAPALTNHAPPTTP